MVQVVDIHSHSSKPNSICIENISLDNTKPQLKEGHYYSAGLHPWYLVNFNISKAMQILEELLMTDNNILAIGECGLDTKCKSDFNLQKKVFDLQISLAEKTNKPLIIHAVGAHNEILAMKKKSKSKVPWVFHGFNQNMQILRQILAQDGYISLGKSLLIHNSNAQKALDIIPMEKLFLETDVWEGPIDELYRQLSLQLTQSQTELRTAIYTNFLKVFAR